MKLAAIFTVCSALFFSCQSDKPDLKIYQGDAFGTTYTIQYYDVNNVYLLKGIDSVFHAVNRSVSTYMPNSDISRINAGDSTVVVDEIFTEVFEVSSEVFKRSKGYFDPTIGVLRNAYGFGEDKPLEKIDSTIIDSLMRYVGFEKVSITPKGTVFKEHPQIYFDFNAVAKGYGIDRIGAYFDQQGINDYLIELGGEILAKGSNIKKNKPWMVGIESIDSDIDDRSITVTVRLGDRALASSGNYRKFRIDSLTGKKYVHTLNPHTGEAEQSDVTSASVIAETCALADAYATAFMALGLDRSKDVITELSGIEAYLTYTDSLGNSGVYSTPGFEANIVK